MSSRKTLRKAPRPIEEVWQDLEDRGLGPIVPMGFKKVIGRKSEPYIAKVKRYIEDDYDNPDVLEPSSTRVFDPIWTAEYSRTLCKDRSVSSYQGLGLVLGAKSGLMEIDMDQISPEEGKQGLRAGIDLFDFFTEEGIFDGCPVYTSPSGGAKAWCKYPPGGRIVYEGKTYLIQTLTKCVYRQGARYTVDILANNHLTTLPGTVRDGKRYEWLQGREFTSLETVPDFPLALVPYLLPEKQGTAGKQCLRSLDLTPIKNKIEATSDAIDRHLQEGKEWEPAATWEVETLVGMLNEQRSDDRDLWARVGMAISSWNHDLGFRIFDTFSTRSDKYDSDGVTKFWESLKSSSTRERSISLGSLHHWAKQDSPEDYALFMSAKRKPYFGLLLGNGDAGKARFVAKEVDGNLICVSTKGDNSWKRYNERTALWEEGTNSDLIEYISDVLRFAVEDRLKSHQKTKPEEEIATETYRYRGAEKTREVVTNKAEVEKHSAYTTKLLSLLEDVQNTPTIKRVIGFLANMLKDEEGICSQLDTIPYLLPLRKKQVLDLRTGEVRPRTREDYFSVECPVSRVGNRNAKDVQTFVNNLWPNPEHRDYMQVLLGFYLTGEFCDRMFWMFYGPVSNGKTAVTSLMERLMGPLAGSVSPNVLCKNRGDLDVKPEPEMEKFMTRRFVSVSEAAKGASLNEAKIKKLTGKDSVGFRLLFSNEYKTFRSFSKIALSTNYLPTFSADDEGMDDRTRYIKFLVKFTSNSSHSYPHLLADGSYEVRKDTDLVDRLTRTDTRANWDKEGICDFLDWVLEGAMKYYENPMLIRSQPEAFANLKSTEKRRLNPVHRFLDARTCAADNKDAFAGREGKAYSGKLAPLYEAYKDWAREEQAEVVSSIRFALEIRTVYPDLMGKKQGAVTVRELILFSEDPFSVPKEKPVKYRKVVIRQPSTSSEESPSSEVTPPDNCIGKLRAHREQKADLKRQEELVEEYGSVSNVAT